MTIEQLLIEKIESGQALTPVEKIAYDAIRKIRIEYEFNRVQFINSSAFVYPKERAKDKEIYINSCEASLNKIIEENPDINFEAELREIKRR